MIPRKSCPPKICIIGAGLAGLRAARHFENFKFDYQILEGSDRIGGRILPFQHAHGYLQHGAEYVNGYENEVYQLVNHYDLLDKEHPRTDDLYLMDEYTITVVDGQRVDQDKREKFLEFITELDEKICFDSRCLSISKGVSVEEKIDKGFRKFLKSVPTEDYDLHRKLLSIYKNYYQTEWSGHVGELALINLSDWTDHTQAEDSAVLNEVGFHRILEDFKSYVPSHKIRLNAKVTNINSEDVSVTLASGECLKFDIVLVTCSLGYLKAHHQTLFTPKLTAKRVQAIERMGFGRNLKVFLEYEKAWWPEKVSTIMIVTDGETKDFMVFQPSSWAKNILVCWIAGDGPRQIANLSDAQLKTLLDNHLISNLSSTGPVFESTRIYYKNWSTDEFALGSYSFLTPQGGSRDTRTLGDPIMSGGRPVIWFAGEHTDDEMYQTTVGAARSGHSTAMRVMESLKDN